MRIRLMNHEDWISVARIYKQGIETKCATFQTAVPDYSSWDKGHLKIGRIVAVDEDANLMGWAALSPISSRAVYSGIAEISIYIEEDQRKKGIGHQLLEELIHIADANDIWTLQSSIIAINKASIELHKRHGFRIVGIRERIARDADGNWQDTVLMERRSEKAT